MSLDPEEKARQKIDAQLHKAGWESIDGEVNGQTGYKPEVQTKQGNYRADYVLYLKGKEIGIIEAKPETDAPRLVLEQARTYAEHLTTEEKYDGYSVPFIFSSNGNEVWFRDLRTEAPGEREIFTFHSPDGLKKFLKKDYKKSKEALKDMPIEDFDPEMWPHQKEAVRNIDASLEKSNVRTLIQMATGSGKTRVAMGLAYRLLNSGYANKILYIPDSRKLADEAYRSFKDYSPMGEDYELGDRYVIENIRGDKESEIKQSDISVTTLQNMYDVVEEVIEGEGSKEDIDVWIDEYDFIITDECHRSIYREDGYGEVLEYFDASELGLTATPADKTVERFDGNWVYKYGYKQAVEDKYVVPYRVHEVETDITMNGVEKDGKLYSPEKLGTEILVEDTTRKIGRELLEEMEDEDELTLIFAKNDAHADSIISVFRDSLLKDPDKIKKVTYKAKYPGDTLKAFKRPYENPTIIVTVRMVTTGIDIKPLRNIVLMRPVKSPILYNQMMGRGTRIYDDKDHFTIFDSVGAVDYFKDKNNPPFNSHTPDTDTDTGGSREGTDTSLPDEPKKIQVTDEIIRSEPIFPTETGKQLTADQFRTKFRNDICSLEQELNEIVEDNLSIEEIENEIQEALMEKSRFYTEGIIRKAYSTEYNTEDKGFLDFVNEAKDGHLRSSEERKKQAKTLLKEEYSFTDKTEPLFDVIVDYASSHRKITEGDFYNPPLSKFGGKDRIKATFEREGIDFSNLLQRVITQLALPSGKRLN